MYYLLCGGSVFGVVSGSPDHFFVFSVAVGTEDSEDFGGSVWVFSDVDWHAFSAFSDYGFSAFEAFGFEALVGEDSDFCFGVLVFGHGVSLGEVCEGFGGLDDFLYAVGVVEVCEVAEFWEVSVVVVSSYHEVESVVDESAACGEDLFLVVCGGCDEVVGSLFVVVEDSE